MSKTEIKICDPISIFHGGGGAFAFYRLYKNPIVFLLKDLPFSDPWHWERWVFLFIFLHLKPWFKTEWCTYLRPRNTFLLWSFVSKSYNVCQVMRYWRRWIMTRNLSSDNESGMWFTTRKKLINVSLQVIWYIRIQVSYICQWLAQTRCMHVPQDER